MKGRDRLRNFPFPGNVRELAHELERSIVFEENNVLEFDGLVAGRSDASGSLGPDIWFNEAFRYPDEGFSLEDSINHLIQHALNQSGNNVSAAARLLGVSRDYVRYRLEGKRGA